MEITKVVKPFIRRGWPNTFGNIVYIFFIHVSWIFSSHALVLSVTWIRNSICLIFVETEIFFQHLLQMEHFCNINDFTVTFDQLNTSLQNTSINLLKKKCFTDPKLLNVNDDIFFSYIYIAV